jgi:hypothetical protein
LLAADWWWWWFGGVRAPASHVIRVILLDREYSDAVRLVLGILGLFSLNVSYQSIRRLNCYNLHITS